MLEKILGTSIEETEEEYKQRVARMSKNDMIDELLRARVITSLPSPASYPLADSESRMRPSFAYPL